MNPDKKGLIVNQLQEKTDLAKENYDYVAFNKSEQNKSEKLIWTLPPPPLKKMLTKLEEAK